jgi:hypothetical protein
MSFRKPLTVIPLVVAALAQAALTAPRQRVPAASNVGRQ